MLNKKLKNLFKVIFFIVLFFVLFRINTYATDYDFDFRFESDGTNFTGITMHSPYTDNTTGEDVLSTNVARGSIWNTFLNKYKILIVGFTGIAALTLVALAMFSFTKLSAMAGNPQKKQEAMTHIGIIILAAMILGAGSLIFGYAYGVFG